MEVGQKGFILTTYTHLQFMHGIPVACISEYKVWVLLHEPKHCIFISGTFVIKWFSHNRFAITDDPFSSPDLSKILWRSNSERSRWMRIKRWMQIPRFGQQVDGTCNPLKAIYIHIYMVYELCILSILLIG